MKEIEAIIVDGVFYERKVSIVDSDTCSWCDLQDMCDKHFSRICRSMIFGIECWKRKGFKLCNTFTHDQHTQ